MMNSEDPIEKLCISIFFLSMALMCMEVRGIVRDIKLKVDVIETRLQNIEPSPTLKLKDSK